MSLAVVFELARRGKRPHVWADETRPLLQGARLTMWELQQRGVAATLICDSAAAQVMREGRIQAVITGADRIAANGDTANKIGTFGVATLARAFGIPFYVVAPTTTFDLAIASGTEIPIEQRAAEGNYQWLRRADGADRRGGLQSGVRCYAGRTHRGDRHRSRRRAAGELGKMLLSIAAASLTARIEARSDYGPSIRTSCHCCC